MKFYSTILLIILFAPGLSDCEGCMKTVDRETCKNAGLYLAETKRDYEAAEEAYRKAKADLGLSSEQSYLDLDGADDREYLLDLSQERGARLRAYMDAERNYKSLKCD